MKRTMQRMKIYLAEDDQDDVDIFKEALQAVCPGCELTVSKNGKDILKKLTDGDADLPDLMFLDVNMPVMNGLDCLKNLKELPLLKNIPVIILTTSAAQLTIEVAYRLGARLFVEKPTNMEHLVKMLGTVLCADWDAHTCPVDMKKFVYR
jgi:CheY-like chemotaxis protein